MKKVEHICFIVPNYPTSQDPVYTFVRELIISISDMGIKCTVIAPQSITNHINKRFRRRPFYWRDISYLNNVVDIYQPIHAPFIRYLSSSLSTIITQWAYKRTFKKIKIKPDTLYAHFWHSGVVAGLIGNKYNIPVFVATGESKIWVNDLYSKKKINNSLKNVRGVICVSSKNKKESTRLNLTSEEKTVVIPNSVNKNQFYKLDKKQVRKKLGFKESDFIVAYTGAFSHRKGVLRLSEATKRLPDVKTIYIGSGKLKPNSDNALHIGRLPHNQIVSYLNAADVFVLPTLAEGCSNAIIEAMACGLPIISSNLPFNNDILNEKNSIRVDSEDIIAISKAIKELKDNPQKRKNMGLESLKIAKNLNVEVRAQKIIEFIVSMKK